MNDDGSAKVHVVKGNNEAFNNIRFCMKTLFIEYSAVVTECPRHYFLTYIVYKDWPLLHRFNKVLLRFAEGGKQKQEKLMVSIGISLISYNDKLVSNSGFATLWYDQTEDAFFKHTYIHRKGYRVSSNRQPFSLNDIQAPFYILIIGYIISFVVFLIEKFVLNPKKFEKLQRIIIPVKRVRSDFQSTHIKKYKKFYSSQKRSLQ